jgi:uncharacterized protein (TIGR00369 family)
MTDATPATPKHTVAAPVPDGFRPARMGGPFIALAGPLYARLRADPEGVRLLMGFRVEQRHCNPLGMCHGGMLATFADMLMPMAAMYQAGGERRFLPTISLQMDYLAPAMLGAWVQGEAQILRTTRNLLFAQGLVSADGTPALRVSGVFKQGPLIGDGTDKDPLKLQN